MSSPRNAVRAGLASWCLTCALTACAASPPPQSDAPRAADPAPTGVTEEQAVGNDEAVSRLANAFCDRSLSCNGIGPGAPSPNRVTCESSTAEHYRRALDALECHDGIAEAGLAQCERSLRAGECSEPGDLLGPAHCALPTVCLDRKR